MKFVSFAVVLLIAFMVSGCASTIGQDQKFRLVNYECPECQYSRDKADCAYQVDRDAQATQPATNGLLFIAIAAADTQDKRTRMFNNCMALKGWVEEPIPEPTVKK